MSSIRLLSSSIAALFAESIERARNAKCHYFLQDTSALAFCESYSRIEHQRKFIPSDKSIPSLTFLTISSLGGGLLLGPAVCQQEQTKHQANPSNVHNTRGGEKGLKSSVEKQVFGAAPQRSSSQL